MKEKRNAVRQAIPVHETLAVGMLLSMVGGFLEAYTYLLRGGVFCNAQTGNIVLLMISLVEGNFWRVLYYIIPITAFFFGILITTFMSSRMTGRQLAAWEDILIVAEILMLFAIGFLPLSAPAGFANITVSFLCSMQYHTFRKTMGMPYATTFCTNNLRLAAENAYYRIAEGDRNAGSACLRYFFIILAFCGGTALGASLAKPLGSRVVWVCCGILLIVLGILLRERWGKRKELQ